MRILVAGRHELAAATLAAAADRHDIVFVRPARERPCRGPTATETARALSLPIIDPGEPSLFAAIRQAQPQVLLSLGHDRIIKPEVLACVENRANVHFGALPRYRGSWSIPHAILNGEEAIGVTLHRLEGGIDDGAIIVQRFIADDGTRSCAEIYDEAVVIGAALAVEWLDGLLTGRVPQGRRQDETLATYFSTVYPSSFRIVWRQTVLQVSRAIRAAAFPPLPGAYALAGDARIEFDWPIEMSYGAPGVACGTIVDGAAGCGIAVLNGVVSPGVVRVDGVRAPFAAMVAQRGWTGLRLT